MALAAQVIGLELLTDRPRRGIMEEEEEEEGRELVMFFMLELPDAAQITTWDMLRAGLLLGGLVHGIGTMRRMVRTNAWLG